MKIFVTGLTSTSLGGMESRNLGNYIIVEPLFSNLRVEFPDWEISTTLQMSESFCARFQVKCLTNKRFWTYGKRAGWETIKDCIRLILWKCTKFNGSLSGSLLLNELSSSDLVVDFSGDVYGDNATWNKFLESNARLLFALALRKPTAMIIGSPGPFSSLWRLIIAKFVLPRLSLITNREPLSTAMLSFVGITGDRIVTTACPSVLFAKASEDALRQKRDSSELFGCEAPLVGIILCGWNMPRGPYNRWPRDDEEFRSFIELIEHLILKTSFRICLMSHQNGLDEKGLLIQGTDHRIVERLEMLCQHRFPTDRVFTLLDVYDAAESKTIISTFELLVSGRIHGAVQGMSQGIPTLILDYGHEPKAHKLRGFARSYGVDDLVVSPNDVSAMIRGIDRLILDQGAERARLAVRVNAVKRAALENFQMLSDLMMGDRKSSTNRALDKVSSDRNRSNV